MLRLVNICKTFQEKSGSKTALNNVSFELPERGMVFILGKSGSGKTTILNLLGGLDKPTKGSIYIKDKELSSMSSRELNKYRAHYVGFIFQEFFLFENRSVKQNLLMMEEISHKKYSDEYISEFLKEVDLEGYEEKKCNLLSSGEKQRISIARCLIKDSKIILADEPTGSLDSENGERIFNILKKISKTRLVVVVSHDLESAEKYADYKIRIKDGEVIEKAEFFESECVNSETYQVEKTHGIKLSHVIKTALLNIKHTWVRMILNFIICFIGLTIFFVASVMTTVDAPSRLVNGLYKNHILSGEIRKKPEPDNNSYGSFSTIDEVNKICEDNPELEFFKINMYLGGAFGGGDRGIAEISQKTLQKQKLLYGEIPSDLNGYFVTKSFAENLLDHLPSPWNKDTTLTSIESLVDYYKVSFYGQTFTLKGIVEDSYLPSYYVYFNEGFLSSVPDIYEKADIEGYCTYMYFIMSGNFKADYKFFKTYHGDLSYHQTNSKYVILTPISGNFYSTMATYISMTDWFYGISAVQMAFIILICFNIITVLIRKNQKENGILRALGYSNFDLFKIYLLQMAIPFILLIPCVCVSGYYIVNALNNLLIKKLAVSYGMFAISPINIVWLLLLCVGIVVISTILPMIKVFKSQPIDIIKAN